jgi:hypothetical protein
MEPGVGEEDGEKLERRNMRINTEGEKNKPI